MPMKPLRPCNYPGCTALTRTRYCETHAVRSTVQRPSAYQRGYTYKWSKQAKEFLRAHPWSIILFHTRGTRVSFGTNPIGRDYVTVIIVKKRREKMEDSGEKRNQSPPPKQNDDLQRARPFRHLCAKKIPTSALQ